MAIPGLTSEFADAAVGLQQVASDTVTAVGPWGIEARLAADSLTLLLALIYIHAGQTILGQPIAWVTPAPLWEKRPSGSPSWGHMRLPPAAGLGQHSGVSPDQGCWHSRGPGARGSRSERRTAGRAQSSSPPRPSRPCSPAGRRTPGMHSGRPPAHKGTGGSGREQAGLQGHIRKAALSLVHQLLVFSWGRFSCAHRLPKAYCSHIQSCACSLAPGYPHPKATSPTGTMHLPGAWSQHRCWKRQPAHSALCLGTDTSPATICAGHPPTTPG